MWCCLEMRPLGGDYGCERSGGWGQTVRVPFLSFHGHTPRKGHVSIQEEQGLLWPKERALTRHCPCWHLILDFQSLKLGETKFPLHPVYRILLWQPEMTNTGGCCRLAWYLATLWNISWKRCAFFMAWYLMLTASLALSRHSVTSCQMQEWMNTNEWSGKRSVDKWTFGKQFIWVLEISCNRGFGDEGKIILVEKKLWVVWVFSSFTPYKVSWTDSP